MTSTFSYAQAAKGITNMATRTGPAPGCANSSKETISALNSEPLASVRSWADDDEAERLPEARDTRQQRSSSKSASRVSHSAQPSNASSPDLGALSSSTVTKDDDVSSIPNTSSESTWDNKSQASTSVDKSAEAAGKTLEKASKEKSIAPKALQEAPLPAVNIWKLRADEQKAKVQKITTTSVPSATPNRATGTVAKKSDSGHLGQSVINDVSKKAGDDTSDSRNGAKIEEVDSKKSVKSKSFEKETRATPSHLPLPSNRDQEAWPTPEIAVDGDRKKALEKGEKSEKERKDGSSMPAHGKHEWVKVAYTPSVIFNTPLPNAANARRGGRPGGRGTVQSSSRPAGSNSVGAGQFEKNGSVLDITASDDQTKPEGSEEASERDRPTKLKQHAPEGFPAGKDQMSQPTGEIPAKMTVITAVDAEVQHRRASTSHIPNHGNHYLQKNQHSGRPGRGRRGDFSSTVERRQDGATSPSNDITLDDRYASAATQTNALAESERRAPVHSDNPTTHTKHSRFGSHNGGRNGGRGGSRGGARAGYANGHQFSNGHTPSVQAVPSLSLTPRSPSSFSPENHSFLPASRQKLTRGSRAQSIGTDSFRYQPYQNGNSISPVQTYNMYEYGMTQPMSAIPYSPYVDQFALFSMITTQVEYYFSVDNLLKDMYLRRHMDSQGFVSLNFIAGFNRIKHLSTDLELIKLVCQQSNVIEYRTSEDGVDHLRRKDGWNQWILNMTDRDKSAQNEGPKELHRPPVPHPAGFDQSMPTHWSAMPSGAATEARGDDGMYPMINGYHVTAHESDLAESEHVSNGTIDMSSHAVPTVNGFSTSTSMTQS